MGDLKEDFSAQIRGDGDQTDFDLPASRIISTSVEVYRMNSDLTRTAFTTPTHWSMDLLNGTLYWVLPPLRDDVITIEGQTYGIFSDAELDKFVNDAILQHVQGRTDVTRYRDGHGFIRYDREQITLTTLPEVEVPLVAMLASVEALWALATDAALDINIQTTEGTVIPRGQRFSQIQAQIQLLLDRYKELSMMLGVGIFKPESFNIRRVSRTTGRLVPVFVEREYDEHGPPTRVVPEIPARDADPDGPPSPALPGYF